MSAPIDCEAVAAALVERACRAGATAADAVVGESDGLDVGIRMGEVEKLTRARERRAGLRVFVGHSTAIVSTADLAPAALDELAAAACTLARTTAPDPHAGLPDPRWLARTRPELDLWDPAIEAVEPADAIARARAAEEAALGYAPEIRNSQGAEFSCGSGRVGYAASTGFTGAYRGSHATLVVSPIAERNGSMQRDHWWATSRHLDALPPPAEIGREAARRAVRRLGARRVATRTCPVVFDPETAASLLRHLASALSGTALYRRASFLLDRLGEPVAAPLLTVLDDPLRPAGLASRPFDGEGVASRQLTVIERGRLQSYFLDTYSARRLGLEPTGHAARPVGDAPTVAPTNLWIAAGPHAPEAIIRSVPAGLYVTEVIGFGVNVVTGDYSRGAAGLWIENGELAYPVEEVTIAGNLRRMLLDIEMVGSDLVFRGATAAPTIKIAQMTVAGE